MYTNVWLITEGNTTLILKQEVLTKRLNSKLLVLWRFISNSSQETNQGLVFNFSPTNHSSGSPKLETNRQPFAILDLNSRFSKILSAM